MNIKWDNYVGNSECDSVFDFVNNSLKADVDYNTGQIETIECEVENNRKAIAELCNILADKMILDVADIVKIAAEYDQDHSFTFEDTQ